MVAVLTGNGCFRVHRWERRPDRKWQLISGVLFLLFLHDGLA